MRIASDTVLHGRQFIDRPPPAPAARERGAGFSRAPAVSIVVPILNEEESVASLYHEVRDVMEASGYSWELVVVDDGSADGSVDRLRAASDGDPRVTIVEFSRRFGQTSALSAGFRFSRGRCIVPIDADLQNDPRDIPRLIEALADGGGTAGGPGEGPGGARERGYDVVSGWRRTRRDALLSRRFPSVLANRLIARLTWTPIHDFGCTLKAYRREVLDGLELYGEMHRFLPALCRWRGARVGEIVVNHRPRLYGRSKYNLRRTFKVLLDLITVKFLGDYAAKPLYFFGKLSALVMLAGLAALGVAVAQKFGYLVAGGEPLRLNRNVLVLLAMMLALMSVMFITFGVLAELLVRIYYESQGKTPYVVRRVRRAVPADADTDDPDAFAPPRLTAADPA